MTENYAFRKVTDHVRADFNSFCVTLFRTKGSKNVRAWYIGPINGGNLSESYLPISAHVLASVAIVRALAAARKSELGVCIIDPENLWVEVWSGVGEGHV